MGRQINFYLGPSDEIDFERSLRRADDIVFLQERGPEPTIVELKTTTRTEGQWSRIIVTQRSLVNLLTPRLIPTLGLWTIDNLDQPVVQFDTCFRDETVITPGRLFRQDSHFVGELLVRKPDSFVRWADSLYRYARKFLTKSGVIYYTGPQAAQMHRDGMFLEGLDGYRRAKRSKE